MILTICGALTVLTAIVHSLLGERMILRPLAATTDLPAVRGSRANTRRTLRFTWHITSVFGLGMAAIYFHYAGLSALGENELFVLRALAVTNFASFLVALVGSRAGHPSWIVFLIIAALTGWVTVR